MLDMAKYIRPSDRQEVKATVNYPVKKAVRACIVFSTYARAGFADGQLGCLWGVGPVSMVDGKGSPWMLATTVLDDYPIVFLKNCKKELEVLKTKYPVLENHIDVRNETAIEWLKWLGFTFEEPEPWGWQGLPFHRFHMGRI
jgi:hypothetical protein